MSGSTVLEDLEDHDEPDPLVGDCVNYTQVCAWIHHCEETHGDRCNVSEFQENAQIAGLKLIDVVKCCIVDAQPSARYFALSYMWGGIKQLQFTSINLDELSLTGSLQNHWESIPRVVRDAMQFTATCNERFLWVDALCIPQDDPKLKYGQIEKMGSIYNRAIAALVAGAGDNANADLSGVRASTRIAEQKKPQYNTVYLIDPGDDEYTSLRKPRDGIPYQRLGKRVKPRQLDLFERLSTSAYNSRAWTFQERILSRRCIYFMENMVYFHCRQSIRAENKAAPYTQNSRLIRQLSLFVSDPIFSGNPLRFQRTLGGVYAGVVFDYTRKNLTFECDVLNAFTGITSSFGKLCYWQFTAGLPVNILDYALLWNQTTFSTRRRLSNFPSWSWAGWNGSIDYSSVLRIEGGYEPFFAKSKTMVSEWNILDERGLRNVVSVLPPIQSPAPPKKAAYISALLSQISMPQMPKHLLIFQAFTLPVQQCIDSSSHDKSKTLALFLRKDNISLRATAIFSPHAFEKDWLSSFGQEDLSNCDLVLLSISKQEGADFEEHWGLNNEVINILLVEWKEGYAERVAEGYMLVNSFQKATGELYEADWSITHLIYQVVQEDPITVLGNHLQSLVKTIILA